MSNPNPFRILAVVSALAFVLVSFQAQGQAAPASGTPAAIEQTPPPPPPQEGGAPTGSDVEVEALNTQAMEAYASLNFAAAQQLLEEAFILCNQQGIAGRALATTYLNLGVLYAGGLRDQVQAIEYYTKALETDRAVTLDPKIAGPDAIATFEKVRAQLGITGPAVAPSPGEPGPTQPPAPGSEGFWVMKHTRVTQAKRMYPLGLYFEVNPMVAVKGAYLYFRFPSDSRYQVAPMERRGNLFGILITCEAIALLDPNAIYYYIEVIGANGTVIASEAGPGTPIEIKMVPEAQFAGQHPVLPGMAAPPERCNPDAVAPCPPWDPHCKDTPCTGDEDCAGRKVCVDGFCQEPEPGAEKEEASGPVGLYLHFGVGTGAGIVTGSVAGRYSESIDLASGFSWSPFFLRLGLGYFVIDELAIGLHTRIQAVPFDKFLPMILPTLRYFPLNDEKLKVHLDFEFDVYGEMRHEIHLKDYNPDTEEYETYSESHPVGLQGVGLGAGVIYLFTEGVGVTGDLIMDAMFPTFAFNFDLMAGLYIVF